MRAGLRAALVILALFSTSLAKQVTISVTSTKFGPSNSQANVGDQIQVLYTVGTASFVQSSFDQPCVPLSGGIKSNIITIPPGQGPQSFYFTLQTSDPLFFFNSDTQTTNKCREGFVGTINATPSQTSQFLSNAKTGQIVASQPPVTSVPPPPPSPPSPPPSSPSDIDITPPFINLPKVPTQTSAQALQVTIVQPVSSSQTLSQPSSLSSFPATPASDASGTPSETSPGATSPTSSLLSVSPSSSPTTIRATPGQTSQPVPSATSHHTRNNNTKTIVVIFAVLLGVVALLAGIFAVLVKRCRDRGALLPQTHRTRAHYDYDGRSSFKPVERAMRSLHRVRTRLAGIRHWGWNLLEENDERRVSPYVAPTDPPPVVEVKARSSHPAPAAREPDRPISEATLVPSVRGSETSDQSDTSDLSLEVNVSSCEKGVKDGVESQSGIDMDTYPFVLSSSSGNARLQKQFPASTSDISRLG